MKKITRLLKILLLITITFIGCSNTNQNNAKKVAEQFVRYLYTIDAKQVIEYNDGFRKNVSITKPGETLQSLLKNIKPLMTDKEYASFIANRGYTMFLDGCTRSDCTMEIIEPVLTQRFYYSKENKIGYDYEAKVKISFNKDKKEQTDVAKGYIGLSKENGQWKVYADKLFSSPKSLTESFLKGTN